ncbi:HD domain-containing protein [Candidatus Formimonas warabiya]|uniref:Metal-dependent phosphohydrolase n=1 Tax=Formimonas warabiya TaxID=1761012 RepID=A0A3G1KUG3_FORW1|nr:HD domain-containing protein [Candidatus Formimonas warabiya]ATW26070.1 metal-dependent phosphohydrolase [Candidatus Formimonas warabiya]
MERVFYMQEKMLEKIEELAHQDMERDMPLNWERIHMISCAKAGQILALKRGVDTELAAIACSVHDYGRIVTGRQRNHAQASFEPLKEFLAASGWFSAREIDEITRTARNHSSKKEIGTPLEEVVKDADVLDCYQFGLPLEREEQRERLGKILQEIKG